MARLTHPFPNQAYIGPPFFHASRIVRWGLVFLKFSDGHSQLLREERSSIILKERREQLKLFICTNGASLSYLCRISDRELEATIGWDGEAQLRWIH